MTNPSAGATIEQYFCTQSGKQGSDPIPPAAREAEELEQFQEKRPNYRIKSTGQINLQEYRWNFLPMKQSAGKLHSVEIVMDAPRLYESTLVAADDVFELGR